MNFLPSWGGVWANRSLHHYEPEAVQRVIGTALKGLKSGGVLGVIVYEGDQAFQDRSSHLNGPSHARRPSFQIAGPGSENLKLARSGHPASMKNMEW